MIDAIMTLALQQTASCTWQFDCRAENFTTDH